MENYVRWPQLGGVTEKSHGRERASSGGKKGKTMKLYYFSMVVWANCYSLKQPTFISQL